MQEVVPETRQVAVATGVSGDTEGVIATVNFDDELYRGSKEISDVAGAHRHLPAKGNAELGGGQFCPQPSF